uniref:Phosphohydrolase n=1 Tax=mine drainage metagenome TaxID=410659 RepID=E6QWC1_9ZZZZ
MTLLTTFTGGKVDYANPLPEQINIMDIATALSRECRYAGHASHFYSVAQHSVLCSRIVLPELAIEALLHDAAEAYLKDIPSPLKALLPDYKLLEARFDRAIREHFGLPELHSSAVKEADNILLVTEIRDLFPPDRVLHKTPIPAEPMNGRIWPLSPETAKDQFLDRFNRLQRKSNG